MSVEYLHLPAGQELPSLQFAAPFKAILTIDMPTTTAWQNEVSDWLVRSGCLYMVAWGIQCSAWDESVDLANTRAFDHGEIPDDRFVMTTWHDDETLEETFWFARYAAIHPTVSLTSTIIIDVSAANRGEEMCAAYQAVAQDI